MNKIYKIEDIPNHISGIYKINFPNGKYYIGLSTNIKNRMRQHNESHNVESHLPVYHAIAKYGKITEFELLEKIDKDNIDLMKERERYWIAYYDATNKNKGYNISPGGDFCGFFRGLDNPNSKLDEKSLSEIRDLIMHSNLTLIEIGEKYNLSLPTIKRINAGITYFDVNLKYPLRDDSLSKQVKSKNTTKNHLKLSERELKEVHELLLNTNLSMDKIAENFIVCQSTISQINLGRGYSHLEGYTYPIRKSKSHNYDNPKHLEEDFDKAIYLLQNTNKTQKAIAEELGFSVTTISKINKGQSHPREDIVYPIRKRKK